jgi:hypothetical protein
MRTSRVKFPLLVTLTAALALPACALDGVVAGGGGGGGTGHAVLDGQVRSVDHRRARLEVRDQWNRGHTVHLDNRTRVVYRQREIAPSTLDRGDLVRIRASRDRRGALWADRIDVREGGRGGEHVWGRVERLAGTVGRVDARRGRFVLHPGRHQSVVVHLPHRLSRDDARRFQRLRSGDRVRVEVVPVGRGTVELVRFR